MPSLLSEEGFPLQALAAHSPVCRSIVWPQHKFSCTAVDAVSGVFTEWGNGSGVPLVRAVASSCAVPGIFPPVSINGRRYIDTAWDALGDECGIWRRAIKWWF